RKTGVNSQQQPPFVNYFASLKVDTPRNPRRLRVSSSEYTDDLLKGATQATGRPVLVRRLLANNPSLASECDSVYVGKLS
ncbi:hypothetical protein SB766_31320, partial [Pseudomonas sp. SIMBA_077]